MFCNGNQLCVETCTFEGDYFKIIRFSIKLYVTVHDPTTNSHVMNAFCPPHDNATALY